VPLNLPFPLSLGFLHLPSNCSSHPTPGDREQ
jgi:hypothetical protein